MQQASERAGMAINGVRRAVGFGPTTSAPYLGAAKWAAERTGRQQHLQLTERAAERTERQQHQLPTAGGPHSVPGTLSSKSMITGMPVCARLRLGGRPLRQRRGECHCEGARGAPLLSCSAALLLCRSVARLADSAALASRIDHAVAIATATQLAAPRRTAANGG